MAQYIVMTTTLDVPGPGETVSAMMYRGDHPTEGDAVDAAAAIFSVTQGTKLWAVLASGLTRYIATVTKVFDTNIG